MSLVTLPNLGPDPFTVNASVLNGKVDPLATDYNGNIQNVNIASGAGITYSKLTLTDGILNADINSSAAIAATKLSLSSIAQSVAMTAKDFTEAKGADIASATTTTIWATDGNFMHITGTTTITSFGTAQQAGDERTIIFDGALTLTHNATTLKLPGGANITTAANDRAIVRADTTANAIVISYTKADGTSIGGVTAAASQAEMEAGTSNTVAATPGRIQFHPGVVKGWAKFNSAGTVAASYNVSSITDNATGDFTVNWGTDFSSADYAVSGTVEDADSDFICIANTAQLAGSTRVLVITSAGVADDPTSLNVMAVGDQA